jgi:hypothetical protein
MEGLAGTLGAEVALGEEHRVWLRGTPGM